MARGTEVDQGLQRQPLVEQVKEYQARYRHAWATSSFLSSTSTSSSSSSWIDVLLVIWELLFFALLVFTCVAFYFKFIGLAFSFLCVAALLYMCMRLTKEERKHKRSKQRMLLPLSM
ncbi:uncharacterized protein LOC100839975 [Brachypodium distachyon]|uniref:Uncharacterized protein n=1 Tax=Brachypodium distachyon TaxID=15368 RepID=I1H8K9_BRADI|nr:uncharacterized protein LOC100839975 [Brachypodium distachyon]XP_024313803.1 uncharacterized protein LOC100839975 [Brachypodium distachyon]KQK23126.1 hypothetical protein BRADI_1g71390v3 [Brachypodium distachyon]KQK23127.1 hypothetical protein BRADI_1g71390v3 [Brachypodium distachyon]|eukprot:XP_010229036.1 uncharacterized protein LOC100839975 [Brachypodium distachyon]